MFAVISCTHLSHSTFCYCASSHRLIRKVYVLYALLYSIYVLFKILLNFCVIWIFIHTHTRTVERQKVMNHLNWPRGRIVFDINTLKYVYTVLQPVEEKKRIRRWKETTRKNTQYWRRFACYVLNANTKKYYIPFFSSADFVVIFCFVRKRKKKREKEKKKSFNVNLNDDQKRNIFFFFFFFFLFQWNGFRSSNAEKNSEKYRFIVLFILEHM